MGWFDQRVAPLDGSTIPAVLLQVNGQWKQSGC
jgi:hypothetical protein